MIKYFFLIFLSNISFGVQEYIFTNPPSPIIYGPGHSIDLQNALCFTPSGLCVDGSGTGAGDWIYGSGVPSSGLGTNGAWFDDSTTGTVYYKSGGLWAVVGSIYSAMPEDSPV